MSHSRVQSRQTEDEQHGLKESLKQLSEHVAELDAYARHYGRVQFDLLEARARRTAIGALRGFFSVCAFTVLTSALLLYSVHAGAKGLAAWISWPVWAGQLVTGSVALLVTILVGWYCSARRARHHLRNREGVYHERERIRRERFSPRTNGSGGNGKGINGAGGHSASASGPGAAAHGG